MAFKFDKSQRLLCAKMYQSVFTGFDGKVHSEHFLLFYRRNNLSHPRLGLAVTKKKIRQAVKRNCIKRHTREFFRLNANLPFVDCVLIVKKGFNDNQIYQELSEIFAKLECLTVNNFYSDSDLN